MPWLTPRGYVMVRVGNRAVFQHRIVMAQTLGRDLLPTEVVHHKDGNKQNNAPENLELHASQSEHLQHHKPWLTRPKPKPPIFCHCGKRAKAKQLCPNHYEEAKRRRNGVAKMIVRLECWCGKPHVGRGLCENHYREAQRLGFPPHLGSLVLHRSTPAQTNTDAP